MTTYDAEAALRLIPEWAIAAGCLVAVGLAMALLVWVALGISAAGARARARADLRAHAQLFEVQNLHVTGGMAGEQVRRRRAELVHAR